MDFRIVLRHYIERALKDLTGMKVLLLDADTVRAVSTVFSQSDILAAEVYLVERLDAPEEQTKEKLSHLQALVFVRPTRENIARLRRELRTPRFGGYHLYFTNRIDNMRLQDLAEADDRELVMSVQEVYGDFIALEGHHAVIPVPASHLAISASSTEYGRSADMVARLTEGISSMMMAMRRKFKIRYQQRSELATNLAKSLHHLTNVEQRELFDFGSRAGETAPLLLILDRKDDPVTPLLTQWTYQAMIHDILGMYDNRCSLHHVVGLRPELAEAVLSSAQDRFFHDNMYSNFGDVGMAVKDLVDSVGRDTLQRKDFQSIDDMASFVEALPDMTAQQGLTAKHVTLMSELSHAVERRQLMEISGLEQDIVCQSASQERHFDQVSALIRSPTVRPFDKARLVALYALRYEDTRPASALLSSASEEGVDRETVDAIRALLRQCTSKTRVMDIFSDRTFSSRMASLAKKHLKGVEVSSECHLERIFRSGIHHPMYSRAMSTALNGSLGLSLLLIFYL